MYEKRKSETKINVNFFFCYYSVQFYAVRSSVWRVVSLQLILENLVILKVTLHNAGSVCSNVPDVTMNLEDRSRNKAVTTSF